MLRIRFTDRDLALTRVAPAADMSAELSLSLHLLATRRPESRLGKWHEQLGRRWKPRSAMLFDLFAATDLPEFLIARPEGGRDTAEATADGMDRDGRGYLRGLGRLRRLTPFARDLANGDHRSRVLLGDLTAEYQSAAITPYWEQIDAVVAAEHQYRTRQLATGGLNAVLATLHPAARWKPPVLSLPMSSPCVTELPLAGRGLVLQPAVFASGRLVIAGFERPKDPPVLIYPLPADRLPLTDDRVGPPPALTALLGRTRAVALDTLAAGGPLSTSDLAAALGIAPATASQHASILADAGLTTKQRQGGTVLHHITLLGEVLLRGGVEHAAQSATRTLQAETN
ncbi:helix-turn-helix domain-containing protein [Kitasatospora aureofaciens]|uniref:helix-turn-helix domain-containing protein n=3 Tax=Kitasatospora aureofaciens TaxID=1894 RepID=UPI0024323627|nr:helix-turn-helix domain-containing protein [Kitasatospora aureofaciens]